MKLLFTTGLATLVGTAAMAHGGAHLHPHGSEPYLAAALVAGLGVAFLTMIRK